MFGSEILDVAIGLVFVYLMLSLISSAVQEGLEAWLKTRAVYLERGIRELLCDEKGTQVATQIYNHPLVYGLYQGTYDPSKLVKKGAAGALQLPRGTTLPSYIPRENFTLALLDFVARGPVDATATPAAPQPITLATLREGLAALPTGGAPNAIPAKLRRGLLAAVDSSEGSLRAAQRRVEAWYDSAMDRVSGAYKRQTQRVLLVLGVSLAVVLNVDTLAIADFLYTHENVRDAIVAEATAVAHDSSARVGQANDVRSRVKQLNDLHLPIGWSRMTVSYKLVNGPGAAWDLVVAPLLGWLMTGLAVSLGAPFWFDVLNKIMVIRSTVKPKEKSPDEPSDDRRKPSTGADTPPAPPPPPAGTPRPPSATPTRGTALAEKLAAGA